MCGHGYNKARELQSLAELAERDEDDSRGDDGSEDSGEAAVWGDADGYLALADG